MTAELAELREVYEESARRALEPLRKRQIEALEAFVRRATQAGDLDAALKGKAELERFRTEAGVAATSFIGEWEYQSGPNTYRRIIGEDGSVELWRNGRVWLNDTGKPWWVGHTWKAAQGKIELRKADGEVIAVWELKKGDSNSVIQSNPGSEKRETLKRARNQWKP